MHTTPSRPPRPHRLRVGGTAAAAVLALVLTGCGDGDSTVQASLPPTTSPTPAPATSSTPATPAATATPSSDVDQTISLAYAGGKITGDTGRVKVKLGSRVRIVVTSDVVEELHLHVYDVTKAVAPGMPTELVFTADVPGQIELELHEAGKPLVRLVIS